MTNQPVIISTQDFGSTDFYLICYLLCCGLQYVTAKRQSDKKLLFILKDTPERQKLVERYYASMARVNPLAFKAKIADLKSVVHNTY